METSVITHTGSTDVLHDNTLPEDKTKTTLQDNMKRINTVKLKTERILATSSITKEEFELINTFTKIGIDYYYDSLKNSLNIDTIDKQIAERKLTYNKLNPANTT